MSPLMNCSVMSENEDIATATLSWASGDSRSMSFCCAPTCMRKTVCFLEAFQCQDSSTLAVNMVMERTFAQRTELCYHAAEKCSWQHSSPGDVESPLPGHLGMFHFYPLARIVQSLWTAVSQTSCSRSTFEPF